MFRLFRKREPPQPAASRASAAAVGAVARILPAGSRPLVYATGAGATRLPSPAAVQLLASLEGCRPVRDPAAEELRARGLLITRAQLLQALRDTADAGQPPQIAAVAWVTHARPAALARSVRSFAANAARSGRSPRWLVCDDSDAPDAARTLEALRGPAREGVRVSYCGPGEKELMAERLVESTRGVVPREVVRFALFGMPGWGSTCGANRNAGVLSTAGVPLLEADDDTVCEPASHPAAAEGLAIGSLRDPSDLLCFESRERLLAAVPRVARDFLAAHESVLGRSPGSCAQRLPDEAIDLSAVSPALAELLVRGGGRVAATTAGVCGDPIVNDPAWLLWLEGDARQRVVASEESFRIARSSREVLRCPRVAAIGDSDFLFGASLGLDCRELLPPFLPMGRGEDILFALTLHLCVPGALIGRPAVALLHDPVEPRAWRDARGVQAFDFLMVLERGHLFPPWSRTPEERMRSLGGALEALGDLGTADFVDAVMPVVLRARAAQLGSAENLLPRHGRQPEYWAREVERYLDAMQEQVAAAPVAPADAPSIDAFRTQVRLYGALLQAWPEIWRAARELAADGPWGTAEPG